MLKPQAKLLIVDDDSTVRSVIGSMISELSVEILETSDGQKALEIIKENAIDIVISDLIMPKMSGLMLLHSMIERGIQIPFILMTGYGDKDSAIQALRLGVFDYLEKPIHEADLRSVVEEAIRVSLDQKVLIGAPADQIKAGVHKIDPRAKSLIMKMKAFHGSQDSKVAEVFPATDEWATLMGLFVQETKLLAGTALAKLDVKSTHLRLVLGSCLRIAQSIRLAAQALQLGSIVDLSWRCELASASLKLTSENYAKDSLQVLKNGFSELKRCIEDLERPSLVKTISELDRLQSKIKKAS